MKFYFNTLVLWATSSIGFHLFGGNWLIGLFIGLCLSLISADIPDKR